MLEIKDFSHFCLLYAPKIITKNWRHLMFHMYTGACNFLNTFQVYCPHIKSYEIKVTIKD